MGRKKVYVDTSAWYALQITDDANHRQAKEVFPVLLKAYGTLITSNHIVGETYTLLRISKGYNEARRYLEILRQSPRLEVHFADPDAEREAFSLLDQYQEHPFSFVDGLSFAIMKREGIRDAFTFDIHFRIAGFNRVGIDTGL